MTQTTSPSSKTDEKLIYLVSLGCSKNLVDSQNIIGDLHNKGYALTFEADNADVFMINTCGFIGPAREEGYEVIEEALAWREKTTGVVAVVGCLAQKDTDGLNEKYPDIDVISGFGGYAKLNETIDNALEGKKGRTTILGQYDVPDSKTPFLLTGGVSAYMKLGEGCTKRCAFCAIPHIRGNQRSVDKATLVEQAKHLAEQGVRELILIAQDPVTYGKDLNNGDTLLDALDALETVDGIDWIRLHYLYPGPMSNKIVKRLAQGGTKLLPYIDIPVQHAHPEILKLMNRPPLENTWQILENARNTIEDAVIRTTFLVGFPGEEEKHFNEIQKFIETIRFDRVGTFTYSPEKGTSAFDLPGWVDHKIMEERRDHIMTLAQGISTEINAAKVGTVQQVIIDVPPQDGNPAIGRTTGQSPEVDGVTYIESDDLAIGDIAEINITDFSEYDLYGEF